MPSDRPPDPTPWTWHDRDGAVLTIRAIGDDDEAREQAFVDALSRETAYRRLFSGRTPPATEIARWTHIDRAREMALVAVESRDGLDRFCGVARYVREDDGVTAAFAIVLADDWQGRGLGGALLRALVDAARAAGVATLSDFTQADNLPMLGLVRRHGFRILPANGDATIRRIELDLDPSPS